MGSVGIAFVVACKRFQRPVINEKSGAMVDFHDEWMTWLLLNGALSQRLLDSFDENRRWCRVNVDLVG